MGTEFEIVYKCFYSKITDDMYMEIDEAQTEALLEELLINALPWFEFPRVNLHNYNLEKHCFNINLSLEEINIIATYMMQGWFDQQLATIELVRMKYSGSDFKFTSQANHISKLLALKKDYERIGLHLQRLYKRRKADANGIFRSTFGSIMAGPSATVSTPSNGNNNNNSGGSGDESWEDMEDLPGDSGGNGSGNDSWDDMEDLPGGDTSDDGGDSM